MTQASVEPVKAVIDEAQKISSGIAHSFVYNKNSELLSSGESTSQEQFDGFAKSFDDLTGVAVLLGGLEALTVQGAEAQLSVNAVDDVYLANVSLRTADQTVVKSLTQVILPTVVRLACQTMPKNEPETIIPTEITPELSAEDTMLQEPEPAHVEPTLKHQDAYVTTNQLLVEKASGLMVASDTVRVDAELVSKWFELYGDEVSRVHVETLDGKGVTCKFKSLKESKKGIIQVPEKILHALQLSKGKLVVVKPAFKGEA